MLRPGTDGEAVESQRSSVASFWLLALLGPLAAAFVLRGFTDSLSPLLSSAVVAFAMPAPLAAAMVVGRRRWSDVGRSVGRAFDNPLALFLLPVITLVVWFFAALALTVVLGNVAGVEGVGRLAAEADDVRTNIATMLDAETAATADVPSVAALVLLGLLGGIIAGLTINAVFAFGEEYGWRGFLWERLAVHGRLGTIGGVGVLWGLWHAPLILVVGFNYPEQRIAGVAAMVVFAVAASWPLDEIRRATGSAVGPAVLHGAVNGSAGALLLVVGGDRLWAAPTGLLGALAFVPAGVVARWLRTRLDHAPSDLLRPR